MITEKDIKRLKQTTGKSGKLTVIGLTVFAVFIFLIALFNIYNASVIGSWSDLSLTDIFNLWIEGIDPNKQYPGVTLLAMQRLQTALSQIVLSIMFFIVRYGTNVKRKMNARILEVLIKSGAIKDV